MKPIAWPTREAYELGLYWPEGGVRVYVDMRQAHRVVTKVGRAWAEADHCVTLTVEPSKSGAYVAKGAPGYSSPGSMRSLSCSPPRSLPPPPGPVNGYTRKIGKHGKIASGTCAV